MQQLTIVTTGGTIDKVYFDDKSTYQIGAPQIGEILTSLGVAFAFEVIPLIRKDSLHIDDADRELVCRERFPLTLVSLRVMTFRPERDEMR